MKQIFLILMLCMQYAPAMASAQDQQAVRDTVTAFVQQQTTSRAGKASFHVDEIDPRIALPQCARFEAFLPAGSQFIGRTAVGVRCPEHAAWSISVPVQIKFSLELLVSARQLAPGHVLQAEDLSVRTMEVSQAGGLTDARQVTGKVLRYGIGAGQMLREEMLRPPFTVLQGQKVQLIVQGAGFSVRSSGVALNDAGEGQLVKVRTDSGKVMSGTALAGGVVAIAP